MLDTHIYIKRKDSIVLTAIEILNELGIQGLSTREIARRQEISEGTLFKHFNNKNEIILTALESLALYDYDIAESIHNKNLKFREAILYYFRRYMEYYESYPSITALLFSYESFKSEPILHEKFNEIRSARKSYILSLIEEAKNSNEISKSIDSKVILNILTGAMSEIILEWRFNGFKGGLKDKATQTLEVLFQVFALENLKTL